MTSKTIVIGGGVVGALSAYYLARAGHDVVLIEKNIDLGAEASAANANQLSYSHIFPPVAPFIMPHVPRILMGLDPVLKVQGLADPRFWLWTFQALPYLLSKACYRKVSEKIWNIHQESRSLMAGFLARHDVAFSHARTGRMMVYDDEKSLDHSLADFKNHGLAAYIHKLSYDETLKHEPALKSRAAFAGALYTPDDEIGDCAAYTRALGGILKNMGVEIRTGCAVRSLSRQGAKISTLTLDNGEVITGDRFVMTAGVWSKPLLRMAGVHVPIYPVRGYTYEIPLKAKQKAPFIASVIDMKLKMVFTPLQNSLKVSNGIFFAPLARPDNQVFLQHMRTAAASIYSDIDFKGAVLRSGYRPWTPNSLPIVERRLDNLYLNVGHGMLGWTMAHGTAKRLADLVTGEGRS